MRSSLFTLVVTLAILAIQSTAATDASSGTELEIVSLFKKLAEEDGVSERSYGQNGEWSNANPRCLKELCTTANGLVGRPETPLNCTNSQTLRMKAPPMELRTVDGEYRQSEDGQCACNCPCNTSKYTSI